MSYCHIFVTSYHAALGNPYENSKSPIGNLIKLYIEPLAD